jgi:ESCRT-II complex subunit VPS22
MAHRRRGVGVGRTSASASASASASTSASAHASVSGSHAGIGTTTPSLVQKKADEMKAISLQHAISTLELLEVKLTQFAQQHQNEIKNDPIFRHRFLQMCAPLGIDVLSTSKQKSNIFRSLFGSAAHKNNQNDYYYELAVKCAEVCLATQSRNGGMMSIQEIQSRLQHRKTKMGVTSAASALQSGTTRTATTAATGTQVTLEDIQIAIQQLSVLGGGFRTMQLPSSEGGNATSTTMVISVPTELDNDHMLILSIAQQQQQQQQGSLAACGITMDEIQQKTKWNNTTRIQRATDLLLQEGMAWIDIYQGVTYYWFTSLWEQQQQKKAQQA